MTIKLETPQPKEANVHRHRHEFCGCLWHKFLCRVKYVTQLYLATTAQSAQASSMDLLIFSATAIVPKCGHHRKPGIFPLISSANLIDKQQLTIRINRNINFISCGYLYQNKYVRIKLWTLRFVGEFVYFIICLYQRLVPDITCLIVIIGLL